MNDQLEVQYRAIRNRCWGQWRKVRAAKSETARNALFMAMVVEIGDVLGVEPSDHDLDPTPDYPIRWALPSEWPLTDQAAWRRLLADVDSAVPA